MKHAALLPIHRSLLLLLLAAVPAGRLLAAPPAWPEEATGTHGAVVSVSAPATRIGLQILQAGGNAVDAAVAVEFALAVSWPEAGNIGGGGFMLIRPSDGTPPLCVDYRERAPLAATETMFSPRDGRHTHKIVGVPGTVRGMQLAHRQFGTLPWKQVVQPAAELARSGVPIDDALAGSLNGVLRQPLVRQHDRHGELVRVYGSRNSLWQVGDRLVLPDLAKTLTRIAERGGDEFYTGETADLLVAEMRSHGGLITERDLQSYEAKLRPAIHGTYRGHDVFGAPPPSSGGICLVEMLNILECFDLDRNRYSVRNLHLMTEAMKRAFRDRALYLADPDFAEIPSKLTEKEYARKLAASIDIRQATPSEELAPPIRLTDEPLETTHFSVIDKEGMAVSNTTTLEGSWGARIVVKDAGFVLNNEMGDFNWFPGRTDRSGRIGTEPNRIRPGQRMLSSQSPTIVVRDGRPLLITGSPGGRTIINTALQLVLNVAEFEMPLPAATFAPRIHHQWLPDQIRFEAFGDRIGADTVRDLRQRGHTLFAWPAGRFQGDAHSIYVDPATRTYHGVADGRRSGAAAAY